MKLPSGTSSSRRAALLAHALAPADQAWLLAGLTASQRAMLEPLLVELRELGISRDPRLLGQVVQAPVEPARAAAMEQLACLDAPRVQALAQLLRKEPPELASALLAARAWPWKAALRASLQGHGAVEPQPAAAARGPLFVQTLCELLVRKLAQAQDDAAPPARARGWRRLLPPRWRRDGA